jgi:hypothetical protein
VSFDEFIHVYAPNGTMPFLKRKEDIVTFRVAGSPSLTLGFDQGYYVIVVGVMCFSSLMDDGSVVAIDNAGFGLFIVASGDITVIHGRESWRSSGDEG